MQNLRPWFSIRRFVMLLGILVLGALLVSRFPFPDRKAEVATLPHRLRDTQRPTSAPERDDLIDGFVASLREHGIELEKDEHMSFWWTVTRPAGGDFRVAVALKSFPLSENEQQMREELLPISLAYILNVPAHLAMSYPGLRGTSPNSAIQSPGDEATMKRLQTLFESYRPTAVKANEGHVDR